MAGQLSAERGLPLPAGGQTRGQEDGENASDGQNTTFLTK